MPTPVEYRVFTDDCFRWAREATTEPAQQAHTRLGQLWLESAKWLEAQWLSRQGREKQEHARREAAVKNMYRLRALRLARARSVTHPIGNKPLAQSSPANRNKQHSRAKC